MPTKSKSSITTRELQSKNRLPPVTPGEILSEEFMKPILLSANALAQYLHVPANRIQAIVTGTRAISADTALRLSRFFGNSAEFWLNLQQRYELDLERRQKLEEIELIATLQNLDHGVNRKPARADQRMRGQKPALSRR
jgi:addiction module HigA family antidote